MRTKDDLSKWTKDGQLVVNGPKTTYFLKMCARTFKFVDCLKNE